MKDQELVKALRAHAEWARANEWETPITLGNDLAEAADRLEKLSEADRDGRVVVLPCQFGEHVFALLDGQKRVRECEVKYAVLDGWLKVFYLAPIDDPGNLYGAPFGAFGQTVFLTPRGGGESIGGEEG